MDWDDLLKWVLLGVLGISITAIIMRILSGTFEKLNIFPEIGEGFSKAQGFLGSAISGSGNFIRNLVGRTGEAGKGFIDILKAPFEGIWNWITGKTEKTKGPSIQERMVDVGGKLGQIGKTGGAELTEDAKVWTDYSKKKLDEMVKKAEPRDMKVEETGWAKRAKKRAEDVDRKIKEGLEKGIMRKHGGF